MTLEHDLGELLPGIGQQLDGVADLVYDRPWSFFVSVQVSPHRSEARSFWLSWDDAEVILQAGEHGGRDELPRTSVDLAFLHDLVESIVAGRVRETFGPRRSRVEVTLANGSVIRETGYASLLPVPGWRRWGRTVQYAPYRKE